MTIKEIKEARKELEQTRQENVKGFNERGLELEREVKELDKFEQETHDKLVKRIKKHFKGVQVKVNISQTKLTINVGSYEILNYKYGATEFSDITRNLATTIISEYEDIYGEVEKEKHTIYSSIKACRNELANITDTTPYVPYNGY